MPERFLRGFITFLSDHGCTAAAFAPRQLARSTGMSAVSAMSGLRD